MARRRRSNNISYIANDASRKTTFKKRQKNLLKKIEEITTLCDIRTCAIVYSNNSSNEKPEIFPNDLTPKSSIISDFQKVSFTEQTKKMLNQESYLIERVKKTREQLRRLQDDNQENRLTSLMHQIFADRNKNNGVIITNNDVTDFTKLVDRNFMEINNLIEVTESGNHHLCLSVGTNVSGNVRQCYQGISPIEMETNLNFVVPNPQEQVCFAITNNNQGVSQIGLKSNLNFVLENPQEQFSIGITNNTQTNVNINLYNGNNIINNYTYNTNCNDDATLSAPQAEQWFIDMMNKSYDAGVGSSCMRFADGDSS